MLALVAVMTGLVHQGIQYSGLAMALDLAPMVIAMQLWIPASVGLAALTLAGVAMVALAERRGR